VLAAGRGAARLPPAGKAAPEPRTTVNAAALEGQARVGTPRGGRFGTARGERPLWGPATSTVLRVTLGLARHSADWRSSPTALEHLATVFRERCGLPDLEVRVAEVDLTNPSSLRGCALVLATANNPLAFTPQECAGMRAYIESGGLLWLNDSSATGDERFDQAFQQALPRILPGARLARLEWDHPLFCAGYDLDRGYKGYPLPPGDKYREEFARGVLFGRSGRLGLLYTRNDYADGLEIDPRMRAGMKSLTDLTPEEMLEGARRFGVNVVAYSLGFAAPRLPPPPDSAAAIEKLYRYHGPALPPFDDFEQAQSADGAPTWVGEDWGNPAQVAVVQTAEGRLLRATFSGGDKAKVVLSRGVELDLSRAKSVVLDIYSGLSEGLNAALLFNTRPNWEGFETRPIFIRPGWNRNLRFPLDLDDFKTTKSDWKNYDAPFAPRNEVARLSVLIYNLHVGGEVRVDSLRVER
jgi:hypothetical protein